MKKLFKNKKIRIVSIIVVVAFVLTISYTLYDFLFVYHIKMNGNKNYVLDYNTVYKDPGIEVKYRGKHLNDYKEEDNINNTEIGSYNVTYTVGNKKVKRTVEVKDIGKPTISLTGGNLYEHSYGKEYKEPGYKAIDNKDGDLTDKVKVSGEVDSKKLGEYTIVYSVSDSSNNKEEVKRVVKVVDDESPKIEFKRNKNTYAIKGKTIDLKDYTAIDNLDGDLTDKVTMSGEVDFNKAGIYTVEYNVVDSNGNKTTEKRIINVQNKNKKGIPVLMYHWFYDDTKGEKAGDVNAHNYISKTNLEAQVKYLKDSNYYFPTWQELLDYIDKKIDLPEKSVIITDDDCVVSFFSVALPVFQENEVPVTSFCITKKETWKLYTEAPYLDFESHTENLHVRKCKGTKWDGAVMCTKYEDIYEDLKTSIEKVGNSTAFAYPFGHYSDDTIKALKANGVKLAFTINSGKVKKGANKYKLPRVRISKDTKIDKYKKLLEG